MLFVGYFLLIVLETAAADYAACTAADSHVQYAEYCYQFFALTTKTYDAAKQKCQEEGGHLAVTISDELLKRVGNVLTEQFAYIALEQLGPNPKKKYEGWFWHINGVLHLAVQKAANWIFWQTEHYPQPDDGKGGSAELEFNDGDRENNAVLRKTGNIYDWPSDMDAATFSVSALCQFRKTKALFESYAEGKMVLTDGKGKLRPLQGISSAEECAARCYINPSCLAIEYNKAEKQCQFYFDRLQDLGARASLIDDPDSSVWVKAKHDFD